MAELSVFLGAVILGSSILGNINSSNLDLIEITGKDNIQYIVKNDNNKLEKVEILTTLNKKIKKLLDYLQKNNYFNNDKIKHVYKKYNPNALSENVDNEYTAYSVNKGEEIKLCLNNISASSNNIIKDENTAMFVLIHENY